jgi:rhomboid protease GluP
MGWAVILFLFGFMMSGINNYAHGGGFVGGYITARLFGYLELKRETPFIKKLAGITFIVTVLSFVFAIVSAFSAI